ncbi:MAG: PHB depolymerase family esterase [Dehalococcoidia bacterium]
MKWKFAGGRRLLLCSTTMTQTTPPDEESGCDIPFPAPHRNVRWPWLAGLLLAALVAGCSDSTSNDGAGATAAVSPEADSEASGAAVAPRPSSGCSQATPNAGVSEQTLMVGAEAGTYREMIPSAAAETEPLPLIIDLHGLGAAVAVVAEAHEFETLGEQQGVFVLTPNGLGPASASGNNSPAFLKALLDASEQRLCIDTARVFMGGISWGGITASTEACPLADRIAAIGVVSGIRFSAECQLSRPLPVMVFHGKLDTTVQYYGGLGYSFSHPGERAPPPPTAPPADTQGFPPVEPVVAQWAAADGCPAEPEVTQVSPHVERRTFGGCSEGSAVEFYVISDGQHVWPGVDLETFNRLCPDCLAIGIQPTQEIKATPLLWDFWMRHPLAN